MTRDLEIASGEVIKAHDKLLRCRINAPSEVCRNVAESGPILLAVSRQGVMVFQYWRTNYGFRSTKHSLPWLIHQEPGFNSQI